MVDKRVRQPGGWKQWLHQYQSELVIGALIGSFLLGGLLFFLNFRFLVVFTVSRDVLILSTGYCLYRLIRRRGERRYPRFLIAAWIFFFVWFLYGVAWLPFATTRAAAISEVSNLATNFALVFCLGLLIDDRKKLQFALRCVKFCAIILVAIMAIQLLTGYDFPSSRYMDPDLLEKAPYHPPTTLFHNENDFAAFLLVVSSLYFSDLLLLDGWRNTVPVLLKMLALFFAITIINSTISLIGVVVLFFVGLCNVCIVYRKQVRIRRTFGYTAAAAGLGVFAYLTNTHLEGFLRRLGMSVRRLFSGNAMNNLSSPSAPPLDDPIRDNLGGQLSNYYKGQGTIHIRAALIFDGLKIAAEHLVFGVGPAGFQYYIQHNPEFLKQTEGIIDPHCFWIELLAQYGLVIFLPFLALCVWTLFRLIRRQKQTSTPEMLSLTLAALLFVFAVIIPSSSIGLYQLWLVFALFLAGAALPEQKN